MKVVIVGGGYAGLSCAQHVREIDSDAEIVVINQEPFCSRPNLFFRFKFPHWHDKHFDYTAGINTTTNDENAFHKKHNLLFLDNHSVLDCNLSDHSITVLNRETSEKLTLSYDKLCMATGGTPNVVSHPLQIDKDNHRAFFNSDQTFGKYVDNVENVLAVRNVEEINVVYSMIRQLHDLDDVSKNIVVVGSGALSLDIVTHIMDGYELVWNHHNKGTASQQPQSKIQREIEWDLNQINMEKLPKIIIVSRKSTIAHPLLQDDAAARLVTNLVTKSASEQSETFCISNYLKIVTDDSVESIVISSDKSAREQHACVGIQTKNKGFIDCSVIIQAIGVNSNNELAQKSGLKIGPKGGIFVNEQYQTFYADRDGDVAVENIYAAGDCAELHSSYIGGRLHDDQTVVWKNWTSAREQAVECAKAMMLNKSGQIWFNQTTRLFGLYVACLGMYHHCSSTDDISLRVVHNEASKRFTKFVFHRVSSDKYKLIGALIIGPEMSDYKLGNNTLECMRSEVAITDESFLDKLLTLNATQWAQLVKIAKENKKNSQEVLTEEQQSQVLSAVAVSAKRVNPLLSKKKQPQ